MRISRPVDRSVIQPTHKIATRTAAEIGIRSVTTRFDGAVVAVGARSVEADNSLDMPVILASIKGRAVELSTRLCPECSSRQSTGWRKRGKPGQVPPVLLAAAWFGGSDWRRTS